MRSRIAGIVISAVFTLATTAFAQSTTQTPPAQPQQRPTDQTQTQQTTKNTNAAQTFTGCLMKETDYRRAHNLGNGAIGGVGLGDEFVLTNVKVSPAKNSASSAKSSESAASSMSPKSSESSASSCTDQGTAYRLTGTAEEKIKGLVGHELEIQGRLKKADTTSASGTETRPNEPGQKEKLPAEVEIISFRETSNREAV